MDRTMRATHCLHNRKYVGNALRAVVQSELTGLAHTVILTAIDSVAVEAGWMRLIWCPFQKD
jgi:Arc/MetJ family transcription regulator